jgi:HopA1 effector protein family
MIHHRHMQQIDEAVRFGRRVITARRVRDIDGLSTVLHERWYLGLTSQQAGVPASSARAWRAWGPLWTPELHEARPAQVRLHLSVPRGRALHVLGMVTARARAWAHPWLFTSTALDAELPAPESTVLRLPAEALLPLRHEIAGLVDDLKPFLALGVPALTLTIGRGASLSEDPADGHTFGEHRCALLARAVLDTMGCHHREQVDRTLGVLFEAGVDRERPYLEAGTRWDRPWRVA